MVFSKKVKILAGIMRACSNGEFGHVGTVYEGILETGMRACRNGE